MTIQDFNNVYQSALASIYDAGEVNAVYNLCMEATLGTTVYSNTTPLTKEQEQALKSYLEQLKQSIPVQYVLGQAYFWDGFYSVTKDTLIPRPETEELLFWIQKEQASNHAPSPLHILDIGTGTGCIAITAKKILPHAAVTAIDISEAALAVARKNAAKHQVDITTLQADILHPTEQLLAHKWDIIISNPPYITQEEKAAMHANVLAHEPHAALFVTNNDPQQFYKAIAAYAQATLSPSGVIFLELNANNALETLKVYNHVGFETEIRQDMQGKHRMLKAWIQDSN